VKKNQFFEIILALNNNSGVENAKFLLNIQATCVLYC